MHLAAGQSVSLGDKPGNLLKRAPLCRDVEVEQDVSWSQ
jgi:hypothetical protein